MELCTGKDLFSKIVHDGKISEQKVAEIILKILGAITYCHSKQITHRDIKPENILFKSNESNNEIKLIDFGLSKKFNRKEKMHTILGTPYYIAPEVLKGEYDCKCDVWSIGAITYMMLCGSPVFNGTSNNEIFKIFPTNNKWNRIYS
jgi:calcium-dependent protein kinase